METVTRKLSKKEYGDMLIAKVRQWISEGYTGEQAVSKLTDKQYDFLIDNDYDIESFWLAPEKIAAAPHTEKRTRTLSPNGYNKKYPQDKQDLYNGIVDYLKSIGCEVTPMAKCNYRDIEFTVKGTKHKIVLSNPRT